MEIWKISSLTHRSRSRSFCVVVDLQRTAMKWTMVYWTHLYSLCCAHLIFCLVVLIDVVVYFRLRPHYAGWFLGVRYGNSFVVRRVSPGRVIVVLFWTKYAVPCQIKPGILKLTIRRGQSNCSIVSISVSREEKGYYHAVSVGHILPKRKFLTSRSWVYN